MVGQRGLTFAAAALVAVAAFAGVEAKNGWEELGCTFNNGATMQCDRLDLTFIPDDIPTTITTFKGKQNYIHDGGVGNLGMLTASTMAPLADRETLEEIQLNNNRIVEIEANTFDKFGDLLVLRLVGNDLPSVEGDAFSGLFSLGELWLNTNPITTIRAGAFDDFRTTLYALNLKSTDMYIVEDGSLNNIVVANKSAGLPFVVDTREAVSLCATSPTNEVKCICGEGLVGEESGFCERSTSTTTETTSTTTTKTVTTTTTKTVTTTTTTTKTTTTVATTKKPATTTTVAATKKPATTMQSQMEVVYIAFTELDYETTDVGILAKALLNELSNVGVANSAKLAIAFNKGAGSTYVSGITAHKVQAAMIKKDIAGIIVAVTDAVLGNGDSREDKVNGGVVDRNPSGGEVERNPATKAPHVGKKSPKKDKGGRGDASGASHRSGSSPKKAKAKKKAHHSPPAQHKDQGSAQHRDPVPKAKHPKKDDKGPLNSAALSVEKKPALAPHTGLRVPGFAMVLAASMLLTLFGGYKVAQRVTSASGGGPPEFEYAMVTSSDNALAGAGFEGSSVLSTEPSDRQPLVLQTSSLVTNAHSYGARSPQHPAKQQQGSDDDQWATFSSAGILTDL